MASIVFDREDADDQVLAQALYVNDVDLGDEETDQVNLFWNLFVLFHFFFFNYLTFFLLLQPPASGEEYLRQVVRQANKLQFATTAENADQLLNQVITNYFWQRCYI